MKELHTRNLFRSCAVLVAGLAALLVCSARPIVASNGTLYLDARYNFEGTKLVGPRQVVIVGPNPFRSRWAVAVQASTIPGPDLTNLTKQLSTLAQSKVGNISNLLKKQVAAPQCASSPQLGFSSVTAQNFHDCVTQFMVGVASSPDPSTSLSLLAATNALQSAERNTITNVDALLDVPGYPNPNQSDPAADPDHDQNARAAFVTRYKDNLSQCVLNSPTPTSSPAPARSAVACPVIPALATDGNIPTIIADVKVAQDKDKQVALEDQQLKNFLASSPSPSPSAIDTGNLNNAETVMTSSHNLLTGLLNVAPPADPLTTPSPEAIFVQAPGQTWIGTFIFQSEDNPTYSSCHGYLFDGVALKYVLSVSSPSPSPSPTTSTEPSSSSSPAPGRKHQHLHPVRVADTLSSMLDAGKEMLAKATPTPNTDQGGKQDQADSQTATTTGMTAEIDCLPIAFVSVGYAVDGVPNVSYTTVPDNTANLMAAKPSQMATIQKHASGPRSVLDSLANFQIGQATDNGSSFAYTLGVGLPVSNPGPGWKYEIVTGPSYTFARTFTVTVGGAFGSTYQLQPGYTLGGPIKIKMAPPTQTNNFTPGWFVSGSFYIPTGKTSTPKPKDTPQPKATPHKNQR